MSFKSLRHSSIVLLFLTLSDFTFAGPCKLAILSFLGIYITEHRRASTPPKMPAGVQLKLGYHASPKTDLATLDPSYSKAVLRYGPGVYFYVNPEHANRHATSINKGQIKKDRTPHAAVVYEGWVDVTNVFDTQKTYTLKDLEFILNHLS